MITPDEPPSTGASAQVPNSYFAPQRRNGMRTSMFEAFFSIAHVTLTGPHFLTGYLLLLGAGNFQLAAIIALPHFLMMFQIAAAYLTAHLGNRKLICSIGIFLHRGVYAVLAFLPFIPGISMEARLWLAFAFMFFSQLALMFAANTWWMWMADLVPERIRGRYFGTRSAITLMLGVVWSLAGAVLLDYYRARQSQEIGFAILFVTASVFAMIGLFYLTRQYEPSMKKEPPPRPRQLLAIFSNSNFRRTSVFFLVWNFGVGLAAAFGAKHMIDHMGMSYQMMMLYPVIINLIGFAVARHWGRVIDRVGTRSTMVICGTIASFVPLTWLFTGPNTTWPIWFDAVMAGVFMTGMNIAAVNLPLLVTPGKHKMHYLGVFSTVAGFGLGIACVAAGSIASVLEHAHFSIPYINNDIVSYHIIFVFSALFRLGSMVLLLRVAQERGMSAWSAVKLGWSELQKKFKRVAHQPKLVEVSDR